MRSFPSPPLCVLAMCAHVSLGEMSLHISVCERFNESEEKRNRETNVTLQLWYRCCVSKQCSFLCIQYMCLSTHYIFIYSRLSLAILLARPDVCVREGWRENQIRDNKKTKNKNKKGKEHKTYRQ